MDWQALFGLGPSPAELVIRGTAVYWFIFLVFRCVLRRDVGAIGIADVLLLVLIADAAQNAMAGAYTTVTDGFILVGTIVGWNYAFDWASHRFGAVRRWSEAPALLLIRDGEILWRNLRREFITGKELTAKLREQGVERIAEVKRARLESDGQISVIKCDPRAESPPGRHAHARPG